MAKQTVLRRWLAFAAIGLVVLAGAALTASHSEARSSATPKWVTAAKQRLDKLEVKQAGSMTGYSRAKFGPAWEDVDLNRCDTRNDILARDLRPRSFKGESECKVAEGTLADPYTKKTISFLQGKKTSSAVQIDHVVALAAAWRTGAKQWTGDLRLFYANDPLVLLAVDGPANSAKGDKDVAAWLPPNSAYRCKYVAQQISIKTKYELWVTPPEQAEMAEVIADC
ncbi:MAG: HNH endonuclease family protein [Gaiellaceae bacterium]